MNTIPAQVAGVERRIVTTPARADGTLAPSVLWALRHCEIEKALKVGGAAAIAAMAFGTESVPKVDKIVGPGNRFVNEAKRQVWGRVGLDGYAGPSEVCVLVDAHANAEWAAADLLTQIEHSEDNAVVPRQSGVKRNFSKCLAAAERTTCGRPLRDEHEDCLLEREPCLHREGYGPGRLRLSTQSRRSTSRSRRKIQRL